MGRDCRAGRRSLLVLIQETKYRAMIYGSDFSCAVEPGGQEIHHPFAQIDESGIAPDREGQDHNSCYVSSRLARRGSERGRAVPNGLYQLSRVGGGLQLEFLGHSAGKLFVDLDCCRSIA